MCLLAAAYFFLIAAPYVLGVDKHANAGIPPHLQRNFGSKYERRKHLVKCTVPLRNLTFPKHEGHAKEITRYDDTSGSGTRWGVAPSSFGDLSCNASSKKKKSLEILVLLRSLPLGEYGN